MDRILDRNWYQTSDLFDVTVSGSAAGCGCTVMGDIIVCEQFLSQSLVGVNRVGQNDVPQMGSDFFSVRAVLRDLVSVFHPSWEFRFLFFK